LLKDLEKAEMVLAGTPTGGEARTSKYSSELRRSWEEASKSALHPELGPARRRNWIAIAAVAVILLAALAALWFRAERGWRAGRTGAETNQASDVPQPAVLAVLPFAGGANPHVSAIGQGLMESVGAKLSGLTENRSLEVIPARSLKEKGLATAADAHRQFGANIALSANLEPSGDLVKVSYILQNVNSGAILGSHAITVPAADVFAAENEILDGTVRALQLKLRAEEQTALKVHGTANPEAYDYYLQARGYLLDYTKPDNIENALLMSRGALKLDPNFGSAKASLGEAYWRKYRFTKDQHLTEQAKEECEAAIALGNAGAAGHICLGLVYGGAGLYRDSATQYQLAVELEPANESAAIGLASALEHQGAVNDAEAAYQRVIDAHPQSYFAYNAMGGFCYRRSEYDKAVQLFKKVTELAPENYAGYVNLGGTYNDQGRFLEAIEPLKKSIALRPSYGGYTNLGTSYFGLHKLKDAADAYQEAVKIDPKQYVTWGNLASAQDYSGAKEPALTSYRRAIALANEELKVNPRNSEVLGDLAVYYAGMGDKQQSLKYLGQALQYGHSEKELLATAAQVYNQLGDTGTALEWMTKAISAGYSARKFQDLVAFQNLVDNPRYQEIVSKGQHPQ
jgi:tetratricopeptide (TPR) repeat protein